MLKEYRTLVPFVRRYRWSYIAGIACLAVTSGSQILIPQFLRRAIDAVSWGGFDLRTIGVLMIQLIGVSIVIALGRFGWRYFIHGASRRIEAELRARLFEKFLMLQPSFYHRSQVGDLMALSTNDMNSVRMASGMALVALFDGVFLTAGILGILFVQSPRIAAIVILPLPFITGLILFAGRFIRGLFLKVQEGFSSLSQQAHEMLSGVRVIKSFVKEQFFLGKFADSNAEYQGRNMKLVRIWGLFFPLVSFLAGITTLLLLRYGGEGVILGSVSAGEFVATLSYLEMLIWPMLGAGFTVNLLQRGAASLQRINAVLDETPEIASPPDGVRVMPSTAISIRNLSFTYPGASASALHGVSLEVPEGSILGILGRTGSGKSTLLRLLPRTDNPPRGTVFVGGVDVLDYDLKTLREAFGSVPQDTFLFSVSLRDNIGFGLDDPDETLIRHAADVSTISRDMQTFPDGWETEVGERGITLSGGQKQRVAISRALAKKPRILVFDDALSAVDTETEELILNQLLSERSATTSIIVSHRVSTLAAADKIAVLDQGRLIQYGTHAELLTQDGFYREVSLLQQLSEQKTYTDPEDI
ncbi:MAG: ABC transporter ATP-binding protein/permease [Spirochaetales bacterium]|nr:ABC transporter ATP-binding protein/permease [Spirochaetales bacterium]